MSKKSQNCRVCIAASAGSSNLFGTLSAALTLSSLAFSLSVIVIIPSVFIGMGFSLSLRASEKSCLMLSSTSAYTVSVCQYFVQKIDWYRVEFEKVLVRVSNQPVISNIGGSHNSDCCSHTFAGNFVVCLALIRNFVLLNVFDIMTNIAYVERYLIFVFWWPKSSQMLLQIWLCLVA